MGTPAPKERGLGAKEESSKISQREQQVKLHTQDRKAVQGRILEFDNEFTAPNYPKSSADETFLTSALGQNFIFSDISKKERKMLIKAFQKDESTPRPRRARSRGARSVVSSSRRDSGHGPESRKAATAAREGERVAMAWMHKDESMEMQQGGARGLC